MELLTQVHYQSWGAALAFTIAYLRGVNKDQDALITGTISLGSFIILGALTRSNEQIAGWIGHYLGAQDVFVAIIVGLVVPALYFGIVNKDLVIKMPDSVPPAVARGFTGIIPGLIVMLVMSFAKLFISMATFLGFGEAAGAPTIFMLFEYYIARLFSTFSQGLLLIVLISLLTPILWFFGLHGANLMAPIMSPVYGTLGTHNL